MKIAIIGFARFGELFADMLSPYGDISIFNRSDTKKPEAILRGYKFHSLDELEKLKDADWVILSVAISATEELVGKISPFVKGKNQLVMDVCSVKVLPCEWMKKNLSSDVQILGAHPMFGPDSIKTGVADKQMVLCPVRIDKKSLVKYAKFSKKSD